MNQSAVYDETLFSILKECKTLPNFLNIVFGFLKRRTDFYCLATDINSGVGLPEGWAEYFVKQEFFRWKSNDVDTSETVPTLEKPLSHSPANENTSSFTTSESYNGATYDNYTWSQTINDVNIVLKLPKHVSSKDLQVTILTQKIIVKMKKSNTNLLEGDLCQKIKHNDAIWSLDNHKLDIHLDKASEIWWDCLVTSEPKLDLSKLDCSRPFEELTEEAQAKIEELTWNQERKRMGLLTSEQLQLQQKLNQGLNAEGCPFKGIDPKTVIIN
ncbi:hypothetical protein RN001_013560 [Aquatica leii]|uniref:Nuclear migration protein nudC n=1 Tax=Aquatica leii TaxID=1421715 RepID=A0AAN7SNS5_9COLE|nr:hypothetical protein RN001_013560 [Aquatica leii]